MGFIPGTARGALRLVVCGALIGSGWWWWGIQSQLTDNVLIAAAFTAILVIAPPSLTTFLIPWSPGGMLLQRIQMRTWGGAAVLACASFYVYYSWEIGTAYWLAQPVAADTGLVSQQVIVGIIGFILIPALLWAPVGEEELIETVRQAHLVNRYELETQADIAILQAKLLRSQQLALVGLSQLMTDERTELATTMRDLLGEINGTLQEIGGGVRSDSHAVEMFGDLDDARDLHGILNYQAQQLTAGPLSVYTPPRRALPAPETPRGDDIMSQRLAGTTPAYTPTRRRRGR
jgi:hypothetical protein